jgi:hypothetical protein
LTVFRQFERGRRQQDRGALGRQPELRLRDPPRDARCITRRTTIIGIEKLAFEVIERLGNAVRAILSRRQTRSK